MSQQESGVLLNELYQIAKIRSELKIPGETTFSRNTGFSTIEMNHLAENLDVTAPQDYLSHRKILGPILIRAKKFVINAVVSPLLRLALSRQWALNHYIYLTAAAVSEMDERLAAIELRIAKLESDRA